MPQVPSTRWCPKAEQLVVLDELYRSGVRTPNASQIQQITAYLSSFGKIEGKNVFYWFQNHKAREKQKLRRLSMLQQQLFHNYYSQFDYFDEASQHCLYHYISQPIQFSDQVNLRNGRQGMNLFSKLETSGSLQSKIAIHGHDWVKNHPISDTEPCFKRLKTLDLFPVKSTGFKDEQNLAQHQ